MKSRKLAWARRVMGRKKIMESVLTVAGNVDTICTWLNSTLLESNDENDEISLLAQDRLHLRDFR